MSMLKFIPFTAEWKKWYNQEDARITQADRERAQGARNASRQQIERSTRRDTLLNHTVRDRTPLHRPDKQVKQQVSAADIEHGKTIQSMRNLAIQKGRPVA